MIRGATHLDLKSIVDIHYNSLPRDFLPRLGKTIMLGYYQKFIENNPIFLCERKEQIIGFVALSQIPLKNSMFFKDDYQSIIIKLLLKPDLWGQALWFILKKKKNYDKYSEISFIAVRHEYQGVGIGSQLIDSACVFLKKKKENYILVKTESLNPRINRFYKKNLFKMIAAEFRFFKKFNVYLRELNHGGS